MPLNVDWGKTPTYIKFTATNPDGDFINDNGHPQHPIGSLMFAMMAVQFGSITEKNAHKVFARLSLYCDAFLNGKLYSIWDGENLLDYPATVNDIKESMNLRVNVSPLNDTEWVTYFIRATKQNRVEPITGVSEWNSASIKRLLKKYEAQYLAE